MAEFFHFLKKYFFILHLKKNGRHIMFEKTNL